MCMCDPTSYATSLADLRRITRRHFFSECGVGIGKIALASPLTGGASRALAETIAAAAAATAPASAPSTSPVRKFRSAAKPPHFPARAKHVIYMFQAGAPSQLDLFDNKPALTKYDGQPVPAEF